MTDVDYYTLLISIGSLLIALVTGLSASKSAREANKQSTAAQSQAATAQANAKIAVTQAEAAIQQATAAIAQNKIALIDKRVEIYQKVYEEYRKIISKSFISLDDHDDTWTLGQLVEVIDFYFDEYTKSLFRELYYDLVDVTSTRGGWEFEKDEGDNAAAKELAKKGRADLKLVKENFRIALDQMRTVIKPGF